MLSATDWARISGEDTVLCRFVRDVRLTESGARVVHYAAGLNPVPRRYLEPVMFPYLRLNGVEVEALPPTLSPAARAARLAADDEAAKRAQDLAREAITRAKAAGALPRRRSRTAARAGARHRAGARAGGYRRGKPARRRPALRSRGRGGKRARAAAAAK